MAGGHGGRRAGAGRPKGAIAPETADIKTMVLGALKAVGGQDYLAARALDSPVAFMGLLGRVLPLQVTGKDGEGLVIDFRWADPPPTIDLPAIEQKVVDIATSFDNDENEMMYSNEPENGVNE